MDFRSYAKISPPNFTKTYHRERVFQILDEARSKLATFISAPPGSGKTTLISSYVSSRDLQKVWYQVDEGDEDLATFFYYVGLAFQTLEIAENFQPLKLTPEYTFGINTFSRRYFREIFHQFSNPFAFVFDNFQEVPSSSPLHELMSNMCAEVPEHGHIYFISRQNPPPPFARLLTHKEIDLLDFETLRFSSEEISEFMYFKGSPVSCNDELTRIAAQSKGWIAGLLHMHDHEKIISSKSSQEGDPGNILFDYFSWEVFNKFSSEKQEILLTSAFLPQMTADSVKQLTENTNSPMMLEQMCLENYFTMQQEGKQSTYQFHPMFRKFLIHCSQDHFPPEKLQLIKTHAAEILLNDGEIEDAVSLFRELNDSDSITRVIMQKAPEYFSQGRHKTITHWISLLPEEIVAGNPWLIYWSGVSQLLFTPIESQIKFEKAHQLFHERTDLVGIWLSWSGIIDSIFIAFRDLRVFDTWVAKLNNLWSLPQIDFPPDVGIRIASSMLVVLAFRQPGNKLLKQKAEELVERHRPYADPSLVLVANTYIVTYYTWIGKFSDAEFALLPIQKFDDHKPDPFARIMRRMSEAALQLNSGAIHKCIESTLDGIRVAEESGIHIWNVTLHQFVAQASLQASDFGTAETYTRLALKFLDDNRNNSAGFQHSIQSWQALMLNDLPLAKKHALTSLTLAEIGGVPYFSILCRIVYINTLLENGDFSEADDQILHTLSLAKSINNNMAVFMCFLLKAHLSMLLVREDETLENLRIGLEIGKKNNYQGTMYWRASIMAKLCHIALMNEIEIEYVRTLIRTNGLRPESNCSMATKLWPCEIRIYTLGRFAVEKQGKLIKFNGKAQRRPMELLKAIIAFGGREVAEKRLSDSLWPDSEGDAAQQALATTLFRLRKLVGENAISRQDKKISIDPYHCWIDCWELERHLNSTNSNSPGKISRIRELYQSQFLPSDDTSWSMPFRDKIHSKTVKSICSHAGYLTETGSHDLAEELYLWGIEIDELVEDFYSGLMRTLVFQGKYSDAHSVFKRCQKTLLSRLGVGPSEETRLLLQSIPTS